MKLLDLVYAIFHNSSILDKQKHTLTFSIFVYFPKKIVIIYNSHVNVTSQKYFTLWKIPLSKPKDNLLLSACM